MYVPGTLLHFYGEAWWCLSKWSNLQQHLQIEEQLHVDHGIHQGAGGDCQQQGQEDWFRAEARVNTEKKYVDTVENF